MTDYTLVTKAFADELAAVGQRTCLHERVVAIDTRREHVVVTTEKREYQASLVINCAGLHSDEVARMCGIEPSLRIQPFRGEYSTLLQREATRVSRPIYPAPNPNLPFLGVHITPQLDGRVTVGPNAVPAFSRSGYHWCDFEISTASRWVTDAAMRSLLKTYWKDGLREITRSLVKPMLTASVKKIIPATRSSDLRRCGAGVRAQAVDDAGHLIDDYVIRQSPRGLHVLNAPSPAATSSLVIGSYISSLACEVLDGVPAPGLDAIVGSSLYV